MVIAIFATQREISFPYRVGEDKFRGPEVVAADGVAGDGADCPVGNTLGRQIRCWIGDFRGATRSLRVIEKAVDVEVDTQLSHLTIIIGLL